MFTVNSSSSFQCTRYPAEHKAPVAFKGNAEPAKSQPDLFQKLESRHAQEKSVKQLNQDWNQFKVRLSGFTAPAMQNAVRQMTDSLNQQLRLSKMYTQGAQQRWNEYKQAHRITEADEQKLVAQKPKFLVLN